MERFIGEVAVSQVEYGVQNLLSSEDPRLTVVMDCRGTSVLGFPVQMLKSCVALVQEHYPMRLASFFLINAPPLVRVVANAIIQVGPFSLFMLFSSGQWQFTSNLEPR